MIQRKGHTMTQSPHSPNDQRPRMDWKQRLAVPLLLAGCASPYTWVKEGATPAESDRDLARCRYEAVAATAGYSSGRVAPTLSGAVAQGLGEGMAIGIRQSELFALCLEAHGYAKRAKSSDPSPFYASPVAAAAFSESVQPAAPIAVKRVDSVLPKRSDPVPADAETASVVRALAESGFPLVGAPIRFLQKESRTYYEAWGSGGRLTQVVCEKGACRIRTIDD